MKKNLIYVVLIILLLNLTSCTHNNNSNNDLIKFDIMKKYYIEIKNDTYIKRITETEDINIIFRYINSLELKNIKEFDKSITKDKMKNIFKIIIKNEKEEIIHYISILGDKLYNKGNWYHIDNNYLVRLRDIYSSLKYNEKIDKDSTIIKISKDNREKLFVKEALKGVWKDYDGNIIRFNQKYLKQGENIYKYYINHLEKNKIIISVYGNKGLYRKDKKLFDMRIEMDETRCNMAIKKIMVFKLGKDIEYNIDMIYLYKDNENIYEVGEFDSYFFYNKRIYNDY